MIKVIHDSKRITLSGRRKDRPKTLPLYKFFEEEELTPEDQAEWNTYTAGLKQGKEKVENKDAKEYTEEEKKELFKLGLSGKNIVAKLKFNNIHTADIWNSIKHNCDKMTQDDLEVYGDDEYQEGDEMTNESIDENDQVVAYVVMP